MDLLPPLFSILAMFVMVWYLLDIIRDQRKTDKNLNEARENLRKACERLEDLGNTLLYGMPGKEIEAEYEIIRDDKPKAQYPIIRSG
jgi:hypothetical protein